MSLERGVIASFWGGETLSLERGWVTSFGGKITS